MKAFLLKFKELIFDGSIKARKSEKALITEPEIIVVGKNYRTSHNSTHLKVSASRAAQRKKKSIPGELANGMSLSLLDIIACGLGGVSLLAVIYMVIKVPVPPPLSNDFIMVDISSKFRGDIGYRVWLGDNAESIMYILPPIKGKTNDDRTLIIDRKLATRLEYANTVRKCKDSDKNCKRATSYLYIDRPIKDTWNIQPFFASYPNQRGYQRARALLKTECKYWTRSAALTNKDKTCIDDQIIYGTAHAFPITRLPIH